jgi:hypothetical protein
MWSRESVPDNILNNRISAVSALTTFLFLSPVSSGERRICPVTP